MEYSNSSGRTITIWEMENMRWLPIIRTADDEEQVMPAPSSAVSPEIPETTVSQPKQEPDDITASVENIWGKDMLSLKGRGTYGIKDKLKAMGFTWYRKGRFWIIPLALVASMKDMIESLGIRLPAEAMRPSDDVEQGPIANGVYAGHATIDDEPILVLYGNTSSLRGVLMGMGMRYDSRKGRFLIPMDKVTPDKRTRLEEMGIDMSIMDEPIKEEPPRPMDLDDKAADQIEANLEAEIGSRIEAGKEIRSEDIDKALSEFASKINAMAADPVIKGFLEFAAKFWNYSFYNQMMIWMQNPDSTHVRGAKQWLKMGRRVKDFDKSIGILAPRTFLSREGREIKKTMTPAEWAKEKNKYMVGSRNFSTVEVFDVADTEKIPGWRGPENQAPFEPIGLKELDPNVDVPAIGGLINAAMKWGKKRGINIAYDKMSKVLGGYSAGGTIRINDGYLGINALSTLIHELAHELLHQDPKYKAKKRREETKQEREIDAESTSYVVLRHFGIESKSAPQYLALWKSTGEDVKKRRGNIAKATKEIIEGVHESLTNTVSASLRRIRKWARRMLLANAMIRV